jgi:outer membrane protein assembly factor BamB
VSARVRRCSIRIAVCAALVSAGCDGPDSLPDVARVEVDSLMTINALIGGEPIITARVWSCGGTPPVTVYANGIEVLSEASVTLAADDTGGDVELEGSSVFQVVIPSAELSPAVFGLPPAFDVELDVKCDNIWVRSPPFAMLYLPAQASLAPAYELGRFWPSDDGGDLLVCEDTVLTLYAGGTNASDTLELGFPCGTADMSPGPGARRYLTGVSVGIAAIDPDQTGPTLAWTQPMRLQDWWIEVDENPVVIRDNGGSPEIVVLDQGNGADLVDPVPPPGELPYRPTGATWPLGAVAANTASNEVLVLEANRTNSPPSLTYTVHRLDPTSDLAVLGSVEVQQYDWQIPSAEAVFIYDEDASHIYVSAAPDGETSRWVECVDLSDGAVTWSTDPADGWRYPLGDAVGRTVVASDQDFVWLDPSDGSEISARFAPDSGNRFLRAFIEPDGSIVMLGDPAGGVAQGLYIFAPDGTLTVRFHPGAAIMRWVAPGWSDGALVSFFTELHWLYSRAEYEALATP